MAMHFTVYREHVVLDLIFLNNDILVNIKK